MFNTLYRDVWYACRTFRRAPLVALTIVGTVALGLGLVTVVFTVYSMLFLRVDAVKNPDELYAIRRAPRSGVKSWIPFNHPEYQALRRENSVLTDAIAMVSGITTRIDGRHATCTLVSENFFEMLGIRPAYGRPLLQADARGTAGVAVVLSHRGWQKFFTGTSAVGRTMLAGGRELQIVGVMPEDFRGLAVQPPDFWALLGAAGQFRPDYVGKEDAIGLEVVGRLRPDVQPRAASAALSAWLADAAAVKKSPGMTPVMRLEPSRGVLSSEAIEGLKVFSPVFTAFGLVLMIACANVANLLFARGISRQQELGTRLAIGASRARIVRQLLTESLVLALVSALAAVAISRLVLIGALQLTIAMTPAEMVEQVPLDLPPLDWRVLIFVGIAALGSTALFGLMPAFQSANLEILRTMRGEIVRHGSPGRLREALIAGQVAASTLLLICAAVFLRSAYTAATAEPGVRTKNTISLPIGNESLRAAVLQRLSALPAVVAVAASAPDLRGRFKSAPVDAGEDSRTPPADGDGRPAFRVSRPLGYQFVSPEYFDVLGITLMKGRAFTPVERGVESRVAIVSSETAARLWPGGDAVGKVLRIRPDQPGDARRSPSSSHTPSGTYAVVGVARDISTGGDWLDFRGPHIYLPAAVQDAGTSLTLRVSGDPEQVRRVLTEQLTAIDPSLGEIWTMRALAGRRAYFLGLAFVVTIALGALALALTVSGLYSVLSYLVAQRKQEIGVRIALGASARGVAALVLSQLAKPVGVGLALGGFLAWTLAATLASLAAGTPNAMLRTFDVAAYGGGVVVVLTGSLLAASIPVLRAVRVQPMTSLRRD